MFQNKFEIFSISLLLPIGMLMVTSCVEVTAFKSKVPDEYENIRHHADVKPGQTTRNEVLKKLGQPFINNDEQRVAVYRVQTGHDVVPVLFAAPLPVMYYTEKIIIYALITYDKQGIVEDIDWGIYRQNYLRATFILRASGFLFVSYYVRSQIPHTEILFAPLSDSQAILTMPSAPGTCSLFVIPRDIGTYTEEYYVDNEPLIDRPIPYPGPGFFKISVPAGEHELALKIPMGIFPSLYFRRAFSCESGNLLYADQNVKLVDSGEFWDWNKITYRGEIIVSDIPTQIFNNMQQILYYDGKWFD
jgi:hypothetical protein